ncbi:MAG TPA: hypothetical protein VE988_20195, partial [Gemmataceae bacterium]|nr:hypothetical protein [Gemmataceae bacterium]
SYHGSSEPILGDEPDHTIRMPHVITGLLSQLLFLVHRSHEPGELAWSKADAVIAVRRVRGCGMSLDLGNGLRRWSWQMVLLVGVFVLPPFRCLMVQDRCEHDHT